mmetsp:Transcript_136693/g.354402  ORF Transcript_136693/g.354402 Transcript_136693/m.354402 type:complete len:509 (+) Transcript_136693:712-2238(+)
MPCSVTLLVNIALLLLVAKPPTEAKPPSEARLGPSASASPATSDHEAAGTLGSHPGGAVARPSSITGAAFVSPAPAATPAATAAAAAAAACWSCGVTAAPASCEAAAEDAECAVSHKATRDHLLLQQSGSFAKAATVGRHDGGATAHGDDGREFDLQGLVNPGEDDVTDLGADAGGASALAGSCQGRSVRRRRRNDEMTSCRRRHSSAGFEDADAPEAVWTCDEQQNHMVCDEAKASQYIGFPATSKVKAQGLWCAVPMPPDDWNLKSCPLSAGAPQTTVKVLTYNLFWWNLFKKHDGSGRSAGKLIAETSGPEEYDIMAFQECDDRHRVLEDARLSGLSGEYEALDGGHAVALAYRKSRWTLKAHGTEDVGEDDWHQHYGTRTAQWVRLQHRDGRTVFFVNHHGPLPVGWGGGCTGSSTSINIMRVIAENAHTDDAIILVGDFNAETESSRIQELDRRLNRVFDGTEMGGVDHIFTNCAADAVGTNLGKGRGEHGSDHDALSVTFKF